MTLSTSPDARVYARSRWTALADRLRTVTPEALGRGALTLAVIAFGAWAIASTWPALLPFVVGAVLAYAVLPIANRLDAVMPRFLAALLAELVAVAILVGVVVVVAPPLVTSIGRLANQLPAPEQVQATLTNVQAQVGQLPEPLRTIVLAVATETVANFQGVIDGFVAGLADFVTNQVLQLAGTASFILGLLVIPVWILTVVKDEGSIRRRTGQLIAPAIRTDVFALARIFDRAFGTFLRVRVLLAVVASAFIWVGLELLEPLGVGDFRYAAAVAVLLGSLQLIPELGFFLGFFPLLLVLAIGGPVPFVAAVAVYIVSVRIASGLVETRASRGILDVHPGLLIPAIVVLSEFGLLWLLFAAPLTAILRDTVRYLGGRLADPPKPAGVLPGERRGARGGPVPQAAPPVPSVYRRPTPAAAASFAGLPPPVATSASSPVTASPMPATEWSANP